MSKLSQAAAAILLCAGLSAPAFAGDTVTANASAQVRARTSSEANAEQRICVRAEITGSRMQRNICRTRAEWDRAGGLPTDER